MRKSAHFDRLFAVDREMLFRFLNNIQPDTMEYLRKIYKDDLEDTIVSFINAEITTPRESLIVICSPYGRQWKYPKLPYEEHIYV
ncbi:hypothetical protein B5E53_17010 [Eubacterium sp. An11]|uniref:hypothetical protein n=1 Tax=Eubacterium sp. An11 TaxID=1965542 RepID=UPI000B3A5661|nr:hypothetical protein [Eubacterium sp. An11]OUQ62830.1 hypothetical protein B5E53_17010 [Eubacterium sp. An11]